MPGQFLTTAEREQLNRFPKEIPYEDLISFFTLSASDKVQIPIRSAAKNRLGFALQLCTLRYLGFCPADLSTAPPDTVAYVAHQLDVAPEELSPYGMREHTRTDHHQKIVQYLGFRKAETGELSTLQVWLSQRALEHDKPLLLLQMACEKVYQEKILRPGITLLERMVASARSEAQRETFRRLTSILTEDTKVLLDHLLVPDSTRRRTPLSWLRQSASSNTPQAILDALEKLACLKRWDVYHWDLSRLNPNRLKFLAQLGRKLTNQMLQRMPQERRYPVLVAFLHQSLVDITDEAIDLFDRCLSEAYARARRDLDEFRRSVARATNEKVRLFQELAWAVLDPEISDAELRSVIFQRISQDTLQRAVEESERISRPLDDSYFDFLESRYYYIRQFAPAFLDTFSFRSNSTSDPLLDAVNLLCQLNAERRRKVPEYASVEFVSAKWSPYVIDPEDQIDRHYYELCVLWELRNALRAGNVWLESSRRYANPQTYLIPKDRWLTLRPEVCRQVQTPEDGEIRLEDRETELDELLTRVDRVLSGEGTVRIDNGALVISPLEAEEKLESTVLLEQLIDERLPRIELSELLAEVDSWTQFSRCFEHAGGQQSRSEDLVHTLYASILAQGCNIDLVRMEQIADISHNRLVWCSNWYLREETLKPAVTTIVNFQHHQPLSQYWGGGTLSSSDGQRFPVSGKIRNATALPRYFGYGRGVTFYTWTSDQYSQYGTKVIPATVRDATYVLDEILDNETELAIVEHTTDTTGYTEMVFALFDLLGMQFSPRIRDVGDQRLYRLDRTKRYRNLEPLLRGKINRSLILERWDDLLRIAGSLKLGWVSASLFISKLQAYPRQNALAQALQAYGRLVKTLFILQYIESEEFRRRISGQLNKGEALHALREFLFFANKGKVRRKQEEAQRNQASCLNLVANAVVAWNTVYMTAVIDLLRAEGYSIQQEDLRRLSPARYEHINPYGKYRFELAKNLSCTNLRPLRQPG